MIHKPFGTTTSMSAADVRLLSSSSSSFSTSSSPVEVSGADILASFGDAAARFEGNDVAAAVEALASADAVCFDVDSTVIREEGVDVLAEFLGKGEKVAEFTAAAMGGSMKFEEALAARLAILEPSRADVENCLREHPPRLSSGVERLVRLLREEAGVDVWFVSGGFRPMIEPVADAVGVPRDRIYANTILFRDDEHGSYAGFDADEPTSADGGKPRALRAIAEEHGHKVMVMVGDGATDAQARPPASAFVGYGGVVVREPVKEKACWFVRDFEDMISVVERFAVRRRGGDR